nr:hypothetical protein [Brevibacillus halotolerans]
MPNHKCSNMRLIIAGDIIRLRKYENPVYSGFTRHRYVAAEEESFTSDLVSDLDKAIDNEKDKMDKSLDSRARSNKRARREVINLVNANFNRHSKFITLTYEENMQDVEEARKHFKQFIQRMRWELWEFQIHSRNGISGSWSCTLSYDVGLTLCPEEEIMGEMGAWICQNQCYRTCRERGGLHFQVYD